MAIITISQILLVQSPNMVKYDVMARKVLEVESALFREIGVRHDRRRIYMYTYHIATWPTGVSKAQC